jgi:hypothetical protein
MSSTLSLSSSTDRLSLVLSAFFTTYKVLRILDRKNQLNESSLCWPIEKCFQAVAALGVQHFFEVAKIPMRIWSLLGPLSNLNSNSGTLRT